MNEKAKILTEPFESSRKFVDDILSAFFKLNILNWILLKTEILFLILLHNYLVK